MERRHRRELQWRRSTIGTGSNLGSEVTKMPLKGAQFQSVRMGSISGSEIGTTARKSAQLTAAQTALERISTLE